MFTLLGSFIGALLVCIASRALKGRALGGLAFVCAAIVFVITAFAAAQTTSDSEFLGPIIAAFASIATLLIASPFILLAERR